MKNIIYLTAAIVLLSCNKEEPVEPTPPVFQNGILVLNEGLFQQNNASISFYSNADQSSSQQQFLAANNRGLGDTANDLVVFETNGNQFFVVAVDGSSQLEVIDSKTLITVAQLPQFDGAVGRQPRRVVVTSNKIYSCNYDGTLSIHDKSSLLELAVLDVGQNPDGLATMNGKVYVSNSGGLNAPTYDSTMTIIDANDDSVISTLTTRVNCTDLIAGINNDLYLNSRGDYAGVAPAMLRIDSEVDTIQYEFPVDITSWDYDEGWLYYVDADLNGVYRYSTLTNTFESIQLIDCSTFNTPYTIEVTSDRIYLVDANSYVNSSTVNVYDKTGGFQFDFTAGLNATDFVFND